MRQFLTKLEQASSLDRLADLYQREVRAVLRPQALRDALHGVWTGHPIHPPLAQVTIGAWTSAAVLDYLPGGQQPEAATTLVAVGVASAIPAAVAGSNDFAELDREQSRVGILHALLNVTAVGLYAGSLAARLRGDQALGRILGLAGFSVISGSGFLGGHLAYKQAAQVNQAAPGLHRIEAGWHPVEELASLPEGTLVGRRIDEVPVLVYREGEDVSIMLDLCAHQTGPLSEGEVIQMDGHSCVVCPWHGSTFRLDDGEVVHGPAGTDQPTLKTRVVDGVIHASLP